MKGYFIRSSRVTPSIYFNPGKGIFDMRGKSSPENPLAFYNYVLESLDSYAESGTASMTANLAFEYFNTSSSKCLYIFMKKLSKIDEMGKKVIVNWYFEDGDEDMKEAGEDLCSFFDMEFNFMEIPEIKVLGEEKQSA
ncbi:DUF1987 domain-containing protein [Reichenbachiella sp.]|uniref:DUF1987 domain-containing protein n=1 Tax=Reichenbachiella sp. TaxID=2184521 RepID=UPI003BB106A7